MKRNTKEAARNRWRGILTEFGLAPQFLRGTHGACPMCGGNDRYRWDNKDGNGTFFCTNCGAGDGFRLLEMWTGKPFKELAAEVDKMVGNIQEEQRQRPMVDPTERLRRVGSSLQRLTGEDPASRYLASRGLSSADTGMLRWHNALPYFEEGRMVARLPAMVAALRQPGGAIETFHATYLKTDGSCKAEVNAPKKLLGKRSESIDGCAIPLTEPTADGRIGIAEGIENALSISIMEGIPCWAAYSAHALASFVPPPWVRSVVIFPDADRNFVGQHAATTLASRLARTKGKDIAVTLAPFLKMGVDYNDILTGVNCD